MRILLNESPDAGLLVFLITGIWELIFRSTDLLGRVFSISSKTGMVSLKSTSSALVAFTVEIFLDLKCHDIPNTTKEAVKQSLNLGVKFLTIHISGGREMLEWSANLAKDSNAMILGVSILTSMNQPQFNELGFLGEIKDQVLKFAKLAEDSGLQGMVCSPLEVKLLKENGLKLKLITPGIRFDSDDKGDQKRIMTPKMALISGSDYLVMGRSITKAGSSILERVEYFDSSLAS